MDGKRAKKNAKLDKAELLKNNCEADKKSYLELKFADIKSIYRNLCRI